MSKIKKIVLIMVVLVLVAYGGMAVWFSQPVGDDESSKRFITANPLDLSQIEAFSKYRSCMGHDYRAPDPSSGKIEATPRSMKHYVRVKPQFRGTIDQVSALAPFDGVISVIDDDMGGPGDQQIWLTPDSISPRQWQFVFFHINLKQGLKEGSAVKAGQFVGTASLSRGPDKATDNFDIAVKFTRPMHRPAIDAPFDHMTESVLAEYEKYGINLDELVISEAQRDKQACPIDPKGGESKDVYFLPPGPGDYVWLK